MHAIIKNNSTSFTQTIADNNNIFHFLNDWDERYKFAASNIKMFQPELTTQWTQRQREYFVKLFYHVRGHFAEVLWFMGNFAPDYNTKEMIVGNICDEFGMHGLSHEKLYLNFAKAVGVNLEREFLEKKWYFPFIQKYIHDQFAWLLDHNWDDRVTAFAAIEKLDNIDYVNLLNIALSFGMEKEHLGFFYVHINANHFESALTTSLLEIWDKDRNKVVEIFDFILDDQIKLFNQLSNEIFSYV